MLKETDVAQNNKIPLALQLWSVRDEMANGVPGTLKRLAEMGYEGVETAGTCNLSGEAFRGMLDDAGLACVGMHVGLDALEGEAFDSTVALGRALGTDRLIVPVADLENLGATIDRLNRES